MIGLTLITTLTLSFYAPEGSEATELLRALRPDCVIEVFRDDGSKLEASSSESKDPSANFFSLAEGVASRLSSLVGLNLDALPSIYLGVISSTCGMLLFEMSCIAADEAASGGTPLGGLPPRV